MSKALTAAAAFSLKTCREICTADFMDFSKYGELRGTLPVNQHFFKDNGSNVLAVAHLDSVVDEKFCDILAFPWEPRLYSPTLDDRLGAYAILELLPKLGVKPDILLTNNEESGNTTAAFFQSSKQYNWMFSFDRTGDDVVMYQYMNDASEKLLKKYGLGPVYRGSFSCIGSLEHLGCIGFNFGVGYYEYHTKYGYANLHEFFTQINNFTEFFKREQDTVMPFVPPKKKTFRRRSFCDDDDYPSCLRIWKRGDETIYCQTCGTLVLISDIDAFGECPKCDARRDLTLFNPYTYTGD